MIRARVKTEPAARWSVAREFNRRIKRRFGELGIQIPIPPLPPSPVPPPAGLREAAQ